MSNKGVKLGRRTVNKSQRIREPDISPAPIRPKRRTTAEAEPQ